MMDKTYFGIEIFENNLVSEDEITKLPFYEFWNESMLGSTYLVKNGKIIFILRIGKVFVGFLLKLESIDFQNKKEKI